MITGTEGRPRIVAHRGQRLQAAEPRHDQIEENEMHMLARDDVETFQPVGGAQDSEAIGAQQVLADVPNHLGVFHDKDGLASHCAPVLSVQSFVA